MLKITTFCLAILFSQYLALASQKEADIEEAKIKVENLARKVERGVREKKGGWLLEKKSLRENYAHNRWAADQKFVETSTVYEPSVEVAAKNFRLAAATVSVGLGERITGIGDEAYQWKFKKEYSGCLIVFRKANFVVNVRAATVADAEAFARLLADSITTP